MAGITVEQQIPGGLEVFITEPMPFDQDLKAISEAGGQLASPQQIAQARLVAPRESTLWQRGSWTNVDLVYVPAKYVKGEKSPFVLWTSGQHSPILKYATPATQAHGKGEDFYLPNSDFEAILKQAQADAKKPAASRKVLFDNRVQTFEVSTQKLSEDPLMQFAFDGDVDAYAGKLASLEISNVPVYLAGADYTNTQKQPFARALWLLYADGRSGLDGDRVLYCGGGARGVRQVTPPGAAPNLYETVAKKYNLTPETLGALLEAASVVKK